MTEKANLSFAFNFEFNSTSIENKSFHVYLIKSDIIPHFDLLNNPAICCSSEGGSICDDFYYEYDNKIKNNDLKISSFLKDHAEFYRDYILNETNNNLILKKFIEKKGDKFFYNNPNLKNLKQKNYINKTDKDGNQSSINNSYLNNINLSDNNTDLDNSIDYSLITADNTLIVNEVTQQILFGKFSYFKLFKFNQFI